MKYASTIPGFLLLLCCKMSLSQNAPGIQWEHALGGNKDEFAYGVSPAAGGGYYVAGYSASSGGDVSGHIGHFDFWVVRLDSSGNIQWQKCLGGSEDDFAYALCSTNDDGCIVAGKTVSTDGDVSGLHSSYPDYWVVKLDSSGNIQWQKCLGGTNYDDARAVHTTADGGYIIAGESSSNDGDVTGNHSGFDYWIVKLDSAGNMEWQKSLGGDQDDVARSVEPTADGGYIVAGYSHSNNGDVTGNHGNFDYWIVKLDISGNLEWQTSLGGSAEEQASAIHVTGDGYIISGFTFSNDGDVSGNHGINDYWIVKLRSEGTIEWQKCLGGTADDYGNSVAVCNDSGFVAAGMVGSNDGDVSGSHGNKDFWLAKLDALGNLQWQKCLGGSSYDEAYWIIQSVDGGYITVGETDSNDGDVTGYHNVADYWVAKLFAECPAVFASFYYTSAGNEFNFIDSSTAATSWYWDFGDGTSETSQNPSHTYAPPGTYLVCLIAGDSCSSDTFCETITVIPTGTEEFTTVFPLAVSPNPFSEYTTIQFSLEERLDVKIDIKDASGRKVKTLAAGNFEAGAHTISFYPGNLSAGLYFLELKTGMGLQQQKLIIQ